MANINERLSWRFLPCLEHAMPKIRMVDPDRVPEIVVAGPVNCTMNQSIATLTFTHLRPDAAAPIALNAEMNLEAVAWARLLVPFDGEQSLRDSLDQIICELEIEGATPVGIGAN